MVGMETDKTVRDGTKRYMVADINARKDCIKTMTYSSCKYFCSVQNGSFHGIIGNISNKERTGNGPMYPGNMSGVKKKCRNVQETCHLIQEMESMECSSK